MPKNELYLRQNERPRAPKNAEDFPNVSAVLSLFPFLKPFCTMLFECDRATFLHSMAVDSVAWGMIEDIVRYFPQLQQQRFQLLQLRGILLSHDFGKAFVRENLGDANRAVHDSRAPHQRVLADIEPHYLHAIMSGSLLEMLAKFLPRETAMVVLSWAKLASHHHDDVVFSVPEYQQRITSILHHLQNEAEKLFFFFFKVADTATSLALPKPNNGKIKSWEKLAEILLANKLSEANLRAVFGDQQDFDALLNFIFVSLRFHLKELARKYPSPVWQNAIHEVGNAQPSPESQNLRTQYLTQILENHGTYMEQVARNLGQNGAFSKQFHS